MGAIDIAEDKIIEREGCRLDVYLDSLGKPTCGYGHLVTAADNLQMGEKISKDRAETLLEKDLQCAYKLGCEQAKEIGKNSDEFIAALTCACFQLGDFKDKFPIAFELLKSGNYLMAISDLQSSLWMKQTPVRVNDLILAIKRAFVPWYKRRLGLT